MTAKHLILAYWHSWQKPDFVELRTYLADFLEVGGHQMSADAFVAMCASGARWSDVRLVDSVFGEEGGALCYEGVDGKTGATVKVMEIVHVWSGRIVSLHGLLVATGREHAAPMLAA